MGSKIKFKLLHYLFGAFTFINCATVEYRSYIREFIVSIQLGLWIDPIPELSIKKFYYDNECTILKSAILSVLITSLLVVLQAYVLDFCCQIIELWHYLLIIGAIFSILFIICKYQIRRDKHLQNKLDTFKKINRKNKL